MRWVIVFLCALGASAHADTVGIVVTGEPSVQARITTDATKWVAQHGFTFAASALDAPAITSLLDCLTIDDTVCASAVVAKNAHAESVLVISAEASGSGAKRDVTLHAHWIRKTHNAGSVRRVCEACTDAALDTALEAVLADLTRTTVTGKLKLRSSPSGVPAQLDNQPIGSTPLERDVPVGQHSLAFTHQGKMVGQRWITIAASQPTDLDVSLASPHHGRSRTVPALVLSVGIAAVIAGGVLYATSEESTGKHPTYRDTKAAGIGTAIGGGVLVGAGVFLLLRGDRPGPMVGVASDHVSASWLGRF